MTMMVETERCLRVTVVSDALHDGARNVAAGERAADMIFELLRSAGPSVSGDWARGEISVLVSAVGSDWKQCLWCLGALMMAVKSVGGAVDSARVEHEEVPLAA